MQQFKSKFIYLSFDCKRNLSFYTAVIIKLFICGAAVTNQSQLVINDFRLININFHSWITDAYQNPKRIKKELNKLFQWK